MKLSGTGLKNSSILFLVVVLTLAAYLRFGGFNWGLPQKPYWRAGYQDEPFVMGLILRMSASDYNLHYFINPSFHYYTLFFAINIANALGYIDNFEYPVLLNIDGLPIEKVCLRDYEKMFIVSRLISVIEGILTVLLVYLIGTKLYNKRAGLLAMLIFSIMPTHVFQSHFFVVDCPAVFWSMLAFLYLVGLQSRKAIGLKEFIISGILLGLALGTKYMNFLLVFVFLFIYFSRFRKMHWRYPLVTVLVMFFIFLLTTPHILFSWREFLFGYAEEFGGIFGKSGLLAYNRYPANPIKPFIYVLYYSLKLPLALLAVLCLGYAIYLRRHSEKILFSFLAPFYLILALSPSPHLRHSLPAMPFLALLIAGMILAITKKIRSNYLYYGFVIYVLITIVYTFLFTNAMVNRMKVRDTRYEFADWVFANIPQGTSLAAPTYLPFRYTPPIEWREYDGKKYALDDSSFFANLYYDCKKTNYDYHTLLALAPDYYFITETEYREFPYNKVGEINGKMFVKKLFKQDHYKIIRVFERKFNILGIEFIPQYPNMDWNPVSQKIFLFKRNFARIAP